MTLHQGRSLSRRQYMKVSIGTMYAVKVEYLILSLYVLSVVGVKEGG